MKITINFPEWQTIAKKILYHHDTQALGTLADSSESMAKRLETIKMFAKVFEAFDQSRVVAIGKMGDFLVFINPSNYNQVINDYRKHYPNVKDYEIIEVPFKEWFKAKEIYHISDLRNELTPPSHPEY